MNLYTKIIFFGIISTVFIITYLFEKNNTTRAIQKTLVLSISLVIIASIIAPNTFVLGLAYFMGVGRGPDAVFYLFMIISLAINFILFKKISDNEQRIRKIIQNNALNDFLEKK